ncbi:MAG: hypothetical protein RLZZ537_1673, partial [Pseudomonadota bacterium]
MNYQGSLDGAALRIAVVTARFNDFITDRLQAGALDCLKRHGVAEDAVDTVAVPGAFELPLVALTLAETGRYHAVIC